MNKAMMLSVFGDGKFNPNALNFINAIEKDADGPTALTAHQKSIINTFVKDLLAINSIQANFFNPSNLSESALKAVWPLLLNVNSKKYNLCDPRNLDEAHRLVFNGAGWTHTDEGSKGTTTATTAGISTFFTPSEKLTFGSSHLCIVHDENILPTGNSTTIGATNGLTQSLYFNPRSSVNQYQFECYTNANGRILNDSFDSKGIWLGSRNSAASAFVMKDSSVLNRLNTTTTGSLPNVPLLIGAYNNNGAVSSRSALRINYASVGGGITEQAGYYYQIAINKFLNAFKGQLFFLNPDIDPLAWISEDGLSFYTDNSEQTIILR